MASSSLEDNPRVNYFRLCGVIVDHIPSTLREIFKRMVKEKHQFTWDDKTESGHWLMETKGIKRQVKFPDQLPLLSAGNCEKWDGSLLCDVLLYSSLYLFADKIDGFICVRDSSTVKSKTQSFGRYDPIQGSKVIIATKSKPCHAVSKIALVDTRNYEFRLEKNIPHDAQLYAPTSEWYVIHRLQELRNEFSHLSEAGVPAVVFTEHVERVQRAYSDLSMSSKIKELKAFASEKIVLERAQIYRDQLNEEFGSRLDKIEEKLSKKEPTHTTVYHIQQTFQNVQILGGSSIQAVSLLPPGQSSSQHPSVAIPSDGLQFDPSQNPSLQQSAPNKHSIGASNSAVAPIPTASMPQPVQSSSPMQHPNVGASNSAVAPIPTASMAQPVESSSPMQHPNVEVPRAAPIPHSGLLQSGWSLNASSLQQHPEQHQVATEHSTGLQSNTTTRAGYYKQLLNQCAQTGTIKGQPQYITTDNWDGIQTWYQTKLKVTLEDGRVIEGQSKFLSSKQPSREEAAKDVVQQLEKAGIPVQAQTATVVSQRTGTVPKQALKEYYDKTGIPGIQIIYSTRPQANGFVSKVTVKSAKEVQATTEGKVCRNKKEAEHSAADKLLQELK